MNTKTDICNLAISHLGSGKVIVTLDTEKSAEAIACRTFYDTALEKALRDFSWPFATKIVALGLVEEEPTTEWAYSYQYPSDCLFFRRILSGRRVDHEDSVVPYRITYGDTGTLIFTDKDEAEAEYTVLVTQVGRYPVDFKFALSYLLASMICPRIVGNENAKVQQQMLGLYAMQLHSAHANAMNEQQRDKTPTPSLIRSRGC